MGTYRKIEVKTWGDDKFRALSPLPPCGQGLWLYLLTGPHTNTLPCAFRASRVAMAEELGWTPEDFDKAFAELEAVSMAKADFAARMIFIPNGCKYNPAANPNVVKAWGQSFEDLPECALKTEVYDCVKASLSDSKSSFLAAFKEAFKKPSSNGSTNRSPNGFPNGSSNRSPNGMPNQNRTEQLSNQEGESLQDRVVLHPHARGRELDRNGGQA